MEALFNYIWFIVLIIFLILEIITTALVSVWFCVGAVFAFIVQLLGASLMIQVLTFLIVSLITVILSRPLAKKLVKSGDEVKTNVDSLIGKQAIITQKINNIQGTTKLFCECFCLKTTQKIFTFHGHKTTEKGES